MVFQVLSIEGKSSKSAYFTWHHMPRELRPPQEARASAARGVKRKLSKQLDVDSRYVVSYAQFNPY